eukprot:38263-Hanusia_phi.AAC.2
MLWHPRWTRPRKTLLRQSGARRRRKKHACSRLVESTTRSKLDLDRRLSPRRAAYIPVTQLHAEGRALTHYHKSSSTPSLLTLLVPACNCRGKLPPDSLILLHDKQNPPHGFEQTMEAMKDTNRG